MIGQKIKKRSGNNNQKEPKPFKSGLKVNTVKGIINHPQLNCPAYIFEEDDSYVACKDCVAVEPKTFKFDLSKIDFSQYFKRSDEAAVDFHGKELKIGTLLSSSRDPSLHPSKRVTSLDGHGGVWIEDIGFSVRSKPLIDSNDGPTHIVNIRQGHWVKSNEQILENIES